MSSFNVGSRTPDPDSGGADFYRMPVATNLTNQLI